jgi:hypothetical protein
MAAEPCSYKATDAAPAGAATAAQPAAAAEDLLFIHMYLLDPLHLSGPSSVFQPYILGTVFYIFFHMRFLFHGGMNKDKNNEKFSEKKIVKKYIRLSVHN